MVIYSFQALLVLTSDQILENSSWQTVQGYMCRFKDQLKISLYKHFWLVLFDVLSHFLNCRATERSTGGVCEQTLSRPGEDCKEPKERGIDQGQDRGLEGSHCWGDRIFWCPCGVHPIMVSGSYHLAGSTVLLTVRSEFLVFGKRLILV